MYLLYHCYTSRMAHIAIDARIINSSTGTYVERLLHYLQELDTVNTYSILVPKKDATYWKPSSKNFVVKTIDFDNYSFNEQIGFKKYLDQLAPDLVHFCMPQQPILYKGATVTTIHDLTLLKTYNSDKPYVYYKVKQFIGRFVFQKVARKSNHIITDSFYSEKEIVNRYPVVKNKISTIHLSADISIGSTKKYKRPFRQYILYVGQQSDYKNIRRLGDAHQRLLDKYPDLGLILVGRLNKSALLNKEYFENNQYKNIHFTDFIPNDQRDWLYQNTIAYTFPSLMEGFGLPGLEAMGYGAPVVSSNATCLPEVYGDAAHYFNPSSTDDIARAIDEVISNETLRSSLIKKGYQQLKKYSWEKMAKQTLEVYQNVLTNSSEQ